MNRTVNTKLLKEWAKGKVSPVNKVAALAEVAVETSRKVFKGQCPKTETVRMKISSAIGVDEDELFPLLDSAA